MRDRIGAIAIVAVVIGLGVNLWHLSSQEKNVKAEHAQEPTDLSLEKPVVADEIQHSSASSEEHSGSSQENETTDWVVIAAASEADLGVAEKQFFPSSSEHIPVSEREEYNDAPTVAAVDIQAAINDLDVADVQYLPGLSEAEIALSNEDTAQQRFAVSRSVAWSSDTHGESTAVSADKQMWRMRVASSAASSQNLHLSNVSLPPEGEIFLTDLAGEYTAGPYTSEDVFEGELWTAVVPGEELVLAVTTPNDSDFHLAVAEVNYGYDDFWAKSAGAGSKAAGCNVDAVCQEGERWENERRSVARITVFGRWLCSATLINNTAEDLTPYMLTAAHCLEVNGEDKAQRAANSMVGYWNFESSQCAGQADGSLSQSQSGAILRSIWSSDSSDGNDFALVELNRSPALAHNVYYSGWDAREIAPNAVYGIHHPRGSEKSISASSRQTQVTTRGGAKSTGAGKFLSINGWDYGVTEQGSSGSGLWNEGHLLVGQLWGGLSSCESPRQSDWYGRIASAWEGGGTESAQLKVWLDPDDQGVNTHCGMNNTGLSRGLCNPNAISGQVASNSGSGGSSPDTSARTVNDTEPTSSGGGGGGGGSLGVWLLAAMVLLVAGLRLYKLRNL